MTNKIRKFLFRCLDCQIILSIDFSEKEDIEKVEQDKIYIECPCGGICETLRD